MKWSLRRAAGVGVGVAFVVAVAALSRLPYAPAAEGEALVRLSWRTTGAHVEECRASTAEELERMPVHMRRDEVCERRAVPYRLTVWLNGALVLEETVRPSGNRANRPLYVLRELPVASGEHAIEVAWRPADAAGEAAVGEGLALDARLRLEPGDVTLVTYDLDEHRLVARGRGVKDFLTER